MKVIQRLIPQPQWAYFVQRLDALDLGDLSEADLVKELAAAGHVSQEQVWELAQAAPVVNDELLAYIQNELKPKYQIGILTNVPRSILDRILGDRMDIFELRVVSSEIHLIKPDEKIFHYALKQTKSSPEEVLFFDDSQKNIEVAQRLGIQAVLYAGMTSVKAAVLQGV